MSLNEWIKNGWLRKHTPSKQEIQDLFDIIDRDLRDASATTISADWRFGIAYNAALKLCTILLYSSGYQAEKNLAHYRTLQALPHILGKKHNDDADYLDLCRKKRNETEYDFVGTISLDEALELIEFCKDLRVIVFRWLKTHHKNLI